MGFPFFLLYLAFLCFILHEVCTPTFCFLCCFLSFLNSPKSFFFGCFCFGRTCYPPPPSSPCLYSSFLYLFFSLPFLLAQSLNLLEPRDPDCYVNGLNTDTRARILYVHTYACTYPFSLRMHTRTERYRAKLGFAAFGKCSTLSQSLLSLTS